MKLRFLPIILLLLTSCVSPGTKKALDRAESLVNEAPDSALVIVKAIDRESLKTRSSQARYALLSTMARYKSRIDETEDSTIRVAYDYYQKHGSSLDRLKSAYLLGVVQQNIGNDMGAAIAFHEAEPIARALKEYRWQSLCDQRLGEVYSQNYDHVSAMTYAKRSLEAAELAGESLMTDYCRLDVAAQYQAQEKYDKAKELYDQILAECEYDGYLYSYAARLSAKLNLYKREPEYDKADSLYSVFMEKGVVPLSCEDYGYLGLIAEHKRDRKMADQYCLLAERSMVSQYDSLTLYAARTNIYRKRGDYREAFSSYEEAVAIQNRIVCTQLEQSIAHAMEGYYYNQSEREKEKGQIRLYLSLLIGTVLVGILAWLTGRLLRARREIL